MKLSALTRIVIAIAMLGLGFQTGCKKEVGTANVAYQPSAERPCPPSGYEFETPVRIKAGGDFVSVESPGYACPTFADIDGDDKPDLIVGQFRNGHMQFCKNIAAEGESHRFAAPKWLMSGDEKLQVPGVW